MEGRLGTEIPGATVERLVSPGTRLGRYVIVREIGAGGLGVVYAAHDPDLGRVVALKVLRSHDDPRLQDRLRREAQAMAGLAHPNVVAIYDAGTVDGRVFIAMEHVSGQTLRQWLATPRSPREVIDLHRAAGSGLAAAHAAGIVHRDFKPENVLIGEDGRPRVSDFGSARAVGPGEPVAPLAGAVSSAGPEAMPEPYHAAPEVRRGQDADARSDQFSFCVALYTALYGAGPSGGEALAANVRAGRLGKPSGAARVPRRVRRAIQRGLAVDPAARFASLDELLAALAPPRRHRVRSAVAIGAALVAVSWIVARAPTGAPDQRCTGAAAAFATAWNPQRRGAIAAAFAAVHKPYAEAALRGVTDALDRYAERWGNAHADACRTTRVLGTQTEAVLELRMTCLERRRQEVAALADTLATADTEALARSVSAALGLVDVAACADLAALRQAVPAPTDRRKRAELAGLLPRLAAVRAGYETGAYARALELARPVVQKARELGYRPFEAEAEFVHAQLEQALGDFAGAEAGFNAALWAAEAGRHDELAARAWSALVFLVGYRKSEFARGEALVPRATAAIARLGGDPDIEASLERARDAIAFLQHQLDASAGHAERALALEERVHGTLHPHVARTLESLGTTLMEQGQIDRGLHTLQRALQIYERVLGPDHPIVAHLLSNLGNAEMDAGHPTAAEPALRRALALCEAALGVEHPDTARILAALGRVLRVQGRTAEALAYYRRALIVDEKLFGAGSLQLVDPLLGQGVALARSGQYADADAALRRAETIAAKVLGSDHVRVMRAIAARGDAWMSQARWRDAAALYERVIPVLERVPDARDELADIVCSVGRAYLELRQPARAVERLERIAGAAQDLPPRLRVAVEFTLARALWASGGDRPRARALAVQALATIRQVAGAQHDDRLAIERWLADHRLPGAPG